MRKTDEVRPTKNVLACAASMSTATDLTFEWVIRDQDSLTSLPNWCWAVGVSLLMA